MESTNDVIRNAKTATEKEHKMTLLQGIKLYPKAVAWSLLISTCICMEGYDVCLLSNFCECRLIASTDMLTNLCCRCVPAIQQKVRRAVAQRDVSGASTVAGWSQ